MIAIGAGAVARAAPTPAAAVAASRNWPWPPMLKRPALKPTPTASPPRTSGVAWRIVLRMAVCEPNDALEQGSVGDERQRPVDRPGRDDARGQDDQRRHRRGPGRPMPAGTAAIAQIRPSRPRRQNGCGRPRRRSVGHDAPPRWLPVRARRWPSAGRPPPCSAVRPSSVATSSPRYITAIRSDSSRTSSSSAETSRIAAPASRISIARRWMNSMLPTSRPRVGWSRTSSLGSRAELAGHDRLLLVAAGQRVGGDGRRGRPDVEALDQLAWPRRRSPRPGGRGPRANGRPVVARSGRGCPRAGSS